MGNRAAAADAGLGESYLRVTDLCLLSVTWALNNQSRFETPFSYHTLDQRLSVNVITGLKASRPDLSASFRSDGRVQRWPCVVHDSDGT